MDKANIEPGDIVQVECIDEKLHDATISTLPMYDEKREIPRGLFPNDFTTNSCHCDGAWY